MAESAYHNEALRRQRIIERKRDAQVRLLEGPQSNEMPGYGGADMKDTVLYSGPGHFEQSRITRQVRKKEEHLLREVLQPNDYMTKANKPARKHQLKTPKPLPDSIRNIDRDNVFKILHPYDFH
ncbi:uncharacterized protein LOC127707419 isoform X9 [Mytilus californianus]|uniref:uncharacterized protein LOC127707419 isoform X9 n=1 Tax=Mytilus californianus TaxID=6549 RepID=UPI002246B1AA|nr:uncharacterized protein LOC127707419 isoform X9 [Mytilus californianus]